MVRGMFLNSPCFGDCSSVGVVLPGGGMKDKTQGDVIQTYRPCEQLAPRLKPQNGPPAPLAGKTVGSAKKRS